MTFIVTVIVSPTATGDGLADIVAVSVSAAATKLENPDINKIETTNIEINLLILNFFIYYLQ